MGAELPSVSGFSDTSGRPADTPATKRWVCRAATVASALALAATVAGVLLGSRHLMSPGWLSLSLAAAGAAVGGIGLLVAARRRGAEHRRWLPALLGAAALGAGILAVGYLGFLRPLRLMQSEEFHYDADDAEMRQLCHLIMLWHPNPHDQFINLWHVGDESSIPYILWALRGMPQRRDGGMECTWWHGFDALRHITNNSVGDTREDWVRWYEANRHRSIMEWWADGFTAEGFDVAANGSGDSVRHLLAAMGRTTWCLDDPKPWLSRNAVRMLARLDHDQVRAAIADVHRAGTAGERRGLARYVGGMPEYDLPPLAREEAEPMLRTLLADTDDSVRLYASGVICERQIEWLRNPEGWLIRRYEPGEMDEEEFFCPSDTPFVMPMEKLDSTSVEDPLSYDEPMLWELYRENQVESEPRLLLRLVRGTSDDRTTLSIVLESKGCQPFTRLLTTLDEGADATDASQWACFHDADRHRLYFSVPRFTCAVDTSTGGLLWQMGIGHGDVALTCLLGRYLIFGSTRVAEFCNVYDPGALIVCDAVRGEVVAVISPEAFFDDRMSLVTGNLRFKDMEGNLYVARLPSLPSGEIP
ncbi:MAG: hypothetical protein JXL80_01135 [Planctomycetes bacterium]|nr:hypothetical protein [Planctomycetota bacterium]